MACSCEKWLTVRLNWSFKNHFAVALCFVLFLVTVSSEDEAHKLRSHHHKNHIQHKDRSSWSKPLFDSIPYSNNLNSQYYLNDPGEDQYPEHQDPPGHRHHRKRSHAGRLRRSEDNPNEPRFERDEYLAHVNENIPTGTSVLTVTATDPDQDENGIIIYELRDTADFRVDSGGVIYTKNRLDYESTGGTYRFSVVAKNPDSRGTRVPVILQIRDNEEEPHFDQDHYYFDISEFAETGDYVGTVVAMDDDNDFLGFNLGDLTPPDLFEINRRNGIISVLNKNRSSPWTDFTYDFKAVANDRAGHSTTVPVTVNIIDENTHNPIFDNCSAYNDYVQMENQTAPAFLFTVTATDADYGKNGQVGFYLMDQDNMPEFSIDEESGDVTVEQTLDLEEGPIKYQLTVIAKDRGEPRLENYCSFTIKVGDVNDNPPIFDQERYEQSIPVDSQVDTRILRLTATDADTGENSLITYSLIGSEANDYFRVDFGAGYIYLKKELDASMVNGKVFNFEAKATDQGSPPLYSTVNVEIKVVTAGEKPPTVAKQIPESASVSEDATQNTNIVTLCAVSNAETGLVYMDFLNGNIPETNSEGTFDLRISEDPLVEGCAAGQVAGNIYLAAKGLDFEEIQSYTLTVQLMNENYASSEHTLNIAVLDVNDMPPVLQQPYHQSVSENNPPTLVLTAVAIDKDLSPAFRELTYRFKNPPPEVRMSFRIEEDTGNVWTLHPLDRESINLYRLPIQVSDGVHDREKQYLITVNDQNDEPPVINTEKGIYETQVNEDLAIGKDTGIVISVDDPDVLNEFSYQIVDGNSDEKFRINSKTGTVYINEELNYDLPDNDRNFTLTVRVSDGRSSVSTQVTISVLNVNDLAPVFKPEYYNATVTENVDCDTNITQVFAFDPDYPSDGGDIVYSLNIDTQTNFTIDKYSGVITLVGCMDREATSPIGPYGNYTLYPYAHDEGGTGFGATSKVYVLIKDVNDNHPFIQSPGKPIQIPENADPSDVLPTAILLDDEDSEEMGNGCPCTLAFDASTPSYIVEIFNVTKAEKDNSYWLYTMKQLDREAKKHYVIPFLTTDNNGVSGIRYQRIEVGDKNDSPMSDGNSKISVYNYKSSFPDTIIGSVYVTDADDHDVEHKTFATDPATDAETKENFQVDYNYGNITMVRGTPAGNYTLIVQVTDHLRDENAIGTVFINVVDIPRDAVLQSGSFVIKNVTSRLVMAQTSLDEFFGTSIYDKLRKSLGEVYRTPRQNVDIFTLFDLRPSYNEFLVKVRFNVHGDSGYFLSSHLNNLLLQNKAKVEEDVGITISMIDDNKCIYEDFKYCNRTSCQQELLPNPNEALLVSAPTSTMVGIFITENYTCECGELFPPPKACPANYCYNGGTCTIDSSTNALGCLCRDSDNYGPRCELLTARLKNGFAWYDELGACKNPTLKLSFETTESSGLLLYNGPVVPPPHEKYPRDFIYVILNDWRLEVYLDLGGATGSVSMELEGQSDYVYLVIISWTVDTIKLEVPNCGRNTSYDQDACIKRVSLSSATSILNIGGPLQLGGLATMVPLNDLASYYEWDISLPIVNYFTGCFHLLEYNNETYDLNATTHYKNFYPTCSEEPLNPTELKMSSESVFIIVGSLLLLLLLVLILLVLLRRRKRPDSYPDHLNEIVKETMGRTDIEGYGEKDMTQFDLKLLRVTPDGQLINGHGGQKAAPEVTRQKPVHKAPIARLSEGLSIGSFIEDNTKKVDKEHPNFDDVRHYCFEGDELSLASLSSLGSGTSDDGNYNYLEDWGPRFKPLADLYRPKPDDEVDSEYEFPLPNKDDKQSSGHTVKASPTSPSGHSTSSAASSGANSVTLAPQSEALSPSHPYTRLMPQRSQDDAIPAEPPKVLRGEYHEAVNPLGAYDSLGKESWC